MTVEMCVEFCIKTKGHTYAGTENGSECYCGNVIPQDKLRPDSECNYVCKGDSTQICGGEWRLTIYTG
ncbi:hypothetical protein ACF0H5_007861 [Mactra antiquata]